MVEEKIYYQNGQVRCVTYGDKKTGNYTIRSFWENGKLDWETTYENFALHGRWRTADPSGVIREDGHHKKGKQHGEWKFYDETGKLIKTEYYSRGKLLKNGK
jgi:antitoxin component YwqK of YwqJK toxin-antitoxin module